MTHKFQVGDEIQDKYSKKRGVIISWCGQGEFYNCYIVSLEGKCCHLPESELISEQEPMALELTVEQWFDIKKIKGSPK